MIPKFTMREALSDPNLLGNSMQGPSWSAWRTLLIASRGEWLDVAERKQFYKLTHRTRRPRSPVDEFWIIAGRRGGKSRAEATLATYFGGLCDYSDILAPGETGVLLCVAPDQRQAGIVLDYCEACFLGSPLLKKLVKNRTNDTLELTNRVSIEVRAASFRRLRGPTYVACLVDESAYFFNEDSSNPDAEILNAIRPGLATTGGPLIVASSPYARRGELHTAHRQHFGAKGDPAILVAKGASRDFNPSLSQKVVDRAFLRDPAAARAEYLGEFRSDIEAFLSREAVESCVEPGKREIAPADATKYFAFVDPSGGSGDSFTLAIAHRWQGRAVIDCLRETKPPFSPESVVSEYSKLLRSYHVSRIVGDHYAGLWPREQFAKRGIEYQAHAKPKSELYLSLLASINSQTVDLLDSSKLVTQLSTLERRTSRGGRDSIDHPPSGHDDLANAVAGVTHEVLHSAANRFQMTFAPPILVQA